MKTRKQKPSCGQCLHTSATKIVTWTDHKLDKDVCILSHLALLQRDTYSGNLNKFCFFTVSFFFFFDQLLSRCSNDLKRKLAKQIIHHRQIIHRMFLYTAHKMARAFSKRQALIRLAGFYTTFGS